MTIAATGNEIKGVIDQWSVYGAEAIIGSLVLACKNKPYLKPEDLHRLIDNAVERWADNDR